MSPAKGGGQRRRLAFRIEESIESAVSVSLKDAGEVLKLPCRMLTTPIAGSIIERRRWIPPTKRPIVPHIGPNSSGVCLPFCQDRDFGIVAMQPLSRKHMSFDQVIKRPDCKGPRTDLIGQRRHRQINPLAFEAPALGVNALPHRFGRDVLEWELGRRVHLRAFDEDVVTHEHFRFSDFERRRFLFATLRGWLFVTFRVPRRRGKRSAPRYQYGKPRKLRGRHRPWEAGSAWEFP